MSDWLFDLGNSRFKAAAWEGGAPGPVHAWPHGEAVHQAPVPRGRRAWVASVASQALTSAVLERLHGQFEQVHVASTRAECAGVRIAYPQPHKLGVDRFLALLAAHRLGGDVLVAGVGTALTIDLLDASGQHHGGRIAPSPTLMRAVLHGDKDTGSFMAGQCACMIDRIQPAADIVRELFDTERIKSVLDNAASQLEADK